jgi:hypothetical protein
MRVSRCEVKEVDVTEVENYPLLLDQGIATGEPSIYLEWEGIRGAHLKAGPVRISLDDSAVNAPPQYQYELELSPDEVGALLEKMPIEGVPSVIGGLLRNNPQVIGAVVGQIIAYLVERSPGRGE